MRAMRLERPGSPLVPVECELPLPTPHQVRVRVEACGVCRTDLHVVDGELARPALPLVPGHQIVGRVDVLGAAVTELRRDQRVGIGWLGGTCGTCAYCARGRENLCDEALLRGYGTDGGCADFAAADARFCFPLD